MTTDQSKTGESVREDPSKWARLAQKLSKRAAFNNGVGEHLRQARQGFRDEFELRDANLWRVEPSSNLFRKSSFDG